MPIHDWTRLELGDFHHFHQAWVVNLTCVLGQCFLSCSKKSSTRRQADVPGLVRRQFPITGVKQSGHKSRNVIAAVGVASS